MVVSSNLKICCSSLNLAGNYMFKANDRNTRIRCEICSKLTIQIPEQCHWPCSSVSIVNFEHVITDWEHYSIFWLLLLPSLVRLEQCKPFLCHSQCFCFCQCFFLRDVFKHIPYDFPPYRLQTIFDNLLTSGQPKPAFSK